MYRPTASKKRGFGGGFMIKKLGEWLLVIVLTLVSLEVALQAVVRLGYLDFSLPSYSLANAIPFWQTLNKDFGVWHPANAQYSHRKSCFDVIYSSNAHGMRDAEVALTASSPRTVVLGDSFIEGWGVAGGRRLTDRLQEMTGVPHLNFGTSGGFGTTQAYLLYKTLAAKFDHRAVILAILPDNDFIDDTPTPSALREGAPYRPFLVGTYPDYTLRYPPGGPSQGSSWKTAAIAALDEFWLTFRSRQQIGAVLTERFAGTTKAAEAANPADVDIPSYYFDYKAEQFARLRYAIEQIKQIAGARPMLIFTIPRPRDYLRAAASGTPPPPLVRALESLARDLGITYIDLLQATKNADWRGYFLRCDGHWSSGGHQAVAEQLARWHAQFTSTNR